MYSTPESLDILVSIHTPREGGDLYMSVNDECFV